MKIKLDTVIDAIETADDAFEYYWNQKTGEVLCISDPVYTGMDEDEDREELEENWEDYYRLPTKYDIHEYNIMEEFISQLPAGRIQNTLEAAISGKGAFRRFKDAVNRYGIEKQWYAYEADTYKEIAVRWCKDNDIEYEL